MSSSEEEEEEAEAEEAEAEEEEEEEMVKLLPIDRGRYWIREFSLAEIREATNNFHQALLMRRGRSGDVYKGRIKGKSVAVWWFTSGNWKPDPQWFDLIIEAWSIFYIPENVHKVIGYCKESGHFFVVYEYMWNGSLANLLCRKMSYSSFFLPWEQCLSICRQAARGLEGLHSRFPNFLNDVSATNILLNKNGYAKLSDLYEELGMGDNLASCELDPHFHATGHSSSQTDVYSFGVLLIKVLCRKVWFDYEDRNLGTWLLQCITDGTFVDQIIHPDMKAQIPPGHLEAFLSIAGACLDMDPQMRPTSTELVEVLDVAMEPYSQRFCHCYPYHEIVKATNNFKDLLGEGGEAKVYLGKTETNIPIAVKVLKPDNFRAFEEELDMLSRLNHPNLVSLLGYCNESDYRILVYEFMPNGDLWTALLGNNSLSWEQRLNICVGVARGLRYLQSESEELPKGIIHRDLKPANILLDENFDAKISDFGLSKMSVRNQKESRMYTVIRGTSGYIAPEYIRFGAITRKIDVYAFGVILHEVLCGKTPSDRDYSFYATENEKYGLWAKESVDSRLEGAIAPYCLEVFTDILDKCLNEKPEKRPSMDYVVSVLENAQKWQEAWLRNDSESVFYLPPGGGDRIVLYYESKADETSELFRDCLRVRLLLREFKVPIDERDLSNVLYAEEFKQVFGNTNKVRLPRVFARGKHVGSIELLNKQEELAKLLGMPSPRFICKRCGEDRTCNVCIRKEWFVLCDNCAALTILCNDLEGGLRSCLECNGNMSITKVKFEKPKASHSPHSPQRAIFSETYRSDVGPPRLPGEFNFNG